MAALRFPYVIGSYHRRYTPPKKTMFFRLLAPAREGQNNFPFHVYQVRIQEMHNTSQTMAAWLALIAGESAHRMP